ncbi:hypothetical protein L7F22_042463 [Adiantum nelumboides]|nr:hypothetical protein [Adiantum nelumboides]
MSRTRRRHAFRRSAQGQSAINAVARGTFCKKLEAPTLDRCCRESACGLAGLSAGMAIGIFGDAGVRANAQQPKLFVDINLIPYLAVAPALYGLTVGIIMSFHARQSRE